MRVLVFGDSITQGFWDASGGWVNSLRKYYDEQKISEKDDNPPTVFNLGISGDFTKSVLKRFETETIARKWPGEEFVFIFQVGTNDSLFRGQEYESTPEQYDKELSELLTITKKYSTKTIFVGLTPVIDKLVQPLPWSFSRKCYSTERTKLFDDALKNFTKNNNVAYIDLFGPFASQNLESLFFDGVHPNKEGHELIASLVRPELEKLIRD